MATPLSSQLISHLEGAPTQQIAQQLGISPTQASSAIGAALPLLLGALGHNASQPQGAQDLYGALQDHTGQDVGSALGSALTGGGQGNQILEHVFGSHQPRAAEAVGQTTGIGPDKAHMLLRWLAPVAMAYLAKRMFDQRQAAGNVDRAADSSAVTPTATTTSSPKELGDVLAADTEHAQRGGLLGAVLGHTGALGDLLKAGSSVLGGLGNSTRPSA